MGDLFDDKRALARNTDPATSHAAAESVNVSKLESKVLGILQNFGPMTAEQVAVTLSMQLPTITPRFAPLLDKRMIEKCVGCDGETMLRKSVLTGRKRIVYKFQPDQSLWRARPKSKTSRQKVKDMEAAFRLIREICFSPNNVDKVGDILAVMSKLRRNE